MESLEFDCFSNESIMFQHAMQRYGVILLSLCGKKIKNKNLVELEDVANKVISDVNSKLI